VLDTLVASRKINNFFLAKKKQYSCSRLEWWASKLVILKDLEEEITKIISPEAEVKDTASNELTNIRKKINTLQIRIKEKLES